MNRPQKGELVVAKVKEIRQHSVLTDLLEYPGQEGMIHISEVASGWVKNIRDHVKMNQIVVAKVIFLDRATVGLSLKRVSDREKKEKMRQYNLEKRAEKIFEFMKKKGLTEKDREKIKEAFPSLWSCFETAVKKPEMVRKRLPEIADIIIDVASKNIKKKVHEFRYEISLSSTAPNGIEVVKSVLKPLEKKYEVKYISAGKFLLVKHSDDPKKTEKQIEKDLERVVKAGGSFQRV